MNGLTYKFAAFFGALVAVIGFSMLLAYPYMILWNECLVPAIPALQKVEWMQMWAIAVLIQGLVKSSK